MAEVKSKFDEIMKQFSNGDIMANVPKKLNFEHLNDSLKVAAASSASAAKKRKYSDNQKNEVSLPDHDASFLNSTNNNSFLKAGDENNGKRLGGNVLDEGGGTGLNNSLLSSSSTTVASSSSSSFFMPPSPWEARRMRADLLEARALIAKLKEEISQQHKVKACAEELYEHKVDLLKKQCEFSSNKVLDMEKHLNVVRKREKELRSELVTCKNQLIQQKQMYEEKLYTLQRQYNDYEQDARLMQNQLQNEISELKRYNEHLKMEYELIKQECDGQVKLNKNLKEKSSQYDTIRNELDIERQQHEKCKIQLKQLEYDVQSYGEWKELTKISQQRLMNLSDLEKEVQRLRNDNKNLHESLGNKLLLEEQVYDLRSRLEKYENNNNDLIQLKVQITNLEKELLDWKKIAEDHCPNIKSMTMGNNRMSSSSSSSSSSIMITPHLLRSRIEQLLQKDIILTSEKGITQSERESFQEKIRELQQKYEYTLKSNNDLNKNIKRQRDMTLRIQKKLMFIIRERNSYKQLVENFEKDLTISGAMIEAINPPDAQLKARLDILEKSLAAYKEMCSNLEKELESINLLPDNLSLEVPVNTESYDRLKNEIQQLRIDNDRLRRRKEELELEMEQRCLKGDFMNVEQYKILHMANNPAAQAYENHQNEIEKLQAEIERLKRKIRKLEDDHRDELNRLNNDTATNNSSINTTQINNMTINIKEINTLRAKLEQSEAKIQHMKDIYKQASLEFREVCYMLFGYRIDRIGTANYRISSMYAEHENDYLNFRLNESGVLDMLETDFSISLGDMVKQNLVTHKSLPAFLSTLTLELFNKTTIMA